MMPKSRRCSECETNWEPSVLYCHTCGEKTWPQWTQAPDEDDPRAEEHIPEVIEYRGRLWVSHDELIEAGWDCLESFKIVAIGEAVYELQGYVPDRKADTRGMWWIERIDPETIEVEDTFPEEWGAP